MRSSTFAAAVRADPTGLGNADFSSLLDAIRWIAAFAVLVSHAFNRVFSGPEVLQAPGLGPILFHFLASFGHEAVLVFFVLSGYLVGGKSAVDVAQGRFDARSYLAARIARLYVVLLPALLLTALADAASLHLTDGAGMASRAGYERRDLFTALWNIAMLQYLRAPVFGSNMPLWSLSLEFWFYLGFAIVALGVVQKRERWLAAGLALGLLLFLGPRFPKFAMLWVLGLAAALLPAPREPRPALLWTVTAIFLLALAGSRVIDNFAPRIVVDLGEALAMGALLWAWKARAAPLLGRSRRFNGWAAGFSFSLYAIHYPLVLLLLAMLGQDSGRHSAGRLLDGPGLLLFAAVVAFCVAIAWLFSLATERNTVKVRRWLQRIFGVRSREPRPA